LVGSYLVIINGQNYIRARVDEQTYSNS